MCLVRWLWPGISLICYLRGEEKAVNEMMNRGVVRGDVEESWVEL